jgi:biotin carboxylase
MALTNQRLIIQIHHTSPLFWGAKDNQRWVYDAVKEQGYQVAVITDHAPAWLYELVPSDLIEICDLHSFDQVLMAGRRLSDHGIIQGVLTYAEEFVVSTAFLSDMMGVPGIGLAAARRSSTDKLAMKIALQQAGVPSPAFAAIKTHAELLNCASELEYPVVIKPRCGGGSVAVLKINNSDEASAVFKEVELTARPEIDPIFRQFDGTFLVEQYIGGDLVSVDGLVDSGQVHIVGMTDTLMSREPNFYQLGTWTIETDDRCARVAADAVRALGFRSGGFHCELRKNATGPVVVEVAARLPGELMVKMYEDAFGVDFLTGFLAVISGSPLLKLERTIERVAGTFSCFPGQAGKLVGFNGIETALAHPAVTQVVVNDCIGETVEDLFNPYATVYAIGESLDELKDTLAFARKTISIEIDGGR